MAARAEASTRPAMVRRTGSRARLHRLLAWACQGRAWRHLGLYNHHSESHKLLRHWPNSERAEAKEVVANLHKTWLAPGLRVPSIGRRELVPLPLRGARAAGVRLLPIRLVERGLFAHRRIVPLDGQAHSRTLPLDLEVHALLHWSRDCWESTRPTQRTIPSSPHDIYVQGAERGVVCLHPPRLFHSLCQSPRRRSPRLA
mmetsp:Transcript_71081/g.211914  ORF Transcript_71081/g.211914 Transcript_71081/m.211914 type:complete len:200 (+) Transcript_71081:965-1564(+)